MFGDVCVCECSSLVGGSSSGGEGCVFLCSGSLSVGRVSVWVGGVGDLGDFVC